MNIKKVGALSLFLIAIIGIIAPINAALEVNHLLSTKTSDGKAKLTLSVSSDIGSESKNPYLTKHIFKKDAELNKVQKIHVKINGIKSITFKKPVKNWEIDAFYGIEKSFWVYGSPIGKNFTVKFYDEKNKLIKNNKGKVVYDDPFISDGFVGEKSLETFIGYFNHDKHFNVFKLKNCASYVVSKMTEINEDEIAVQLLKTDIMNGYFQKKSIKYIDLSDIRYGDLYTTVNAVLEVTNMYGRNVKIYLLKPNDFLQNFKKNNEALFYVNHDHFIFVKKISSTKYNVYDQNINDGKPRTFTNDQFNSTILKGGNFRNNFGNNYSYDVFYNYKNEMLVLTDSKTIKSFKKII